MNFTDEHLLQIDRETVVAREVEGEMVILDLSEQRYIGGNPSVTALWPLIEKGARVEQLIDRLIERFGIDRETAERDARAFVKRLDELGLLVRDG